MRLVCLLCVLLVSALALLDVLSLDAAVLLNAALVLWFVAVAANFFLVFLPMILLSCSALHAGAAVDPETSSLIITIIGYLVTHAGSFGWFEWTVLGGIVLHFVALIVVNLTPTPADNLVYGKLYRYLLEPVAGVISKRVKQ